MSRSLNQTDPPPPVDRRAMVLAGCALSAAILAVYGQVVGFDFLGYDDPFYVTNNRQVKGGLTATGFAWAWTSVRAFWHPLTWISHMFDWQFYGARPAGHHLTNLFLHLAAGWVALVAWTRLLGRLWPAALIAAIFVLQPLRAESVAWVAERKGLLAALAWMLGLWAYAEYARRPNLGRYLLVAVALAGGLLCKPSLVTFPFALVLLDLWPLRCWRRVPGGHASLGWLLLEKLPLVALVAAASAVALLAEHEFGALDWIPGLTLASRIENALIAYWLYIAKFVWPSGLAFFYRHPGNGVSAVGAAASAAGLLAVTVLALWQFRARPWLLVGWLWFVGTLVPVIGLVQIGGHRMADRYADIPLVGLAVIVAATLTELIARRPDARPAVVACTLLGLAALALASFRQAGFWRDDETLLAHALAVDPDNWVALTNRARARIDAGDPAGALDDCRRAWKVHPYNSGISSNMADALVKLGRLDEALEWMHTSIRLAPDVGQHHMQLALALADRGQDKEAEESFQRATQLAPRDLLILRNYGAFLGRRKRLDEAAQTFRRILEIAPASRVDRVNLARTLAAAGDYAAAVESLNAALRQDPRDAQAYQVRADLFARQGQAAAALADFQRGAPLPPALMLRLIWIVAADPRAEVRQPAQAVALAEQLAAVTGHRDPAALDALAMSYAAAGRFADAARVARDAVDLARAAGQPDLVAQIENRLALYRTERPFTSPYADLASFWD